MHASRKTVAILAGLQALLFTGNSVGVAIHGLAGLALAENKALATLPVTGWEAVSSSASGVLLHSNGWEILNYLALPFVAAVAVALLWLSARRGLGVRTA